MQSITEDMAAQRESDMRIAPFRDRFRFDEKAEGPAAKDGIKRIPYAASSIAIPGAGTGATFIARRNVGAALS